MDRDTELRLLKRCSDLLKKKDRELAQESVSPVERYFSKERFDREMSLIFKQTPLPVAHTSELPSAGSYKALEWLEDFPLLLVRDQGNNVHAYANTCRHRGSQLKEAGKGCSRSLVCPYHAWTYGLDGKLKGVPQKESGFPSLDIDTIKLMELPCQEAQGFIWVQRDGQSFNLDKHLKGLKPDFRWFGAEDHVLFAEATKDWNLNWKILVEGGIEAYHFKVAHKKTIAPLFNDNLLIFDEFTPHFRSVLTKKSLKSLQDIAEEEWNIRESANVLYSIYPFTSILVQPDHFAVINAIPLGPEKTRITIQTLIPKGSDTTEKSQAHWQTNFELTRDTLYEDFVIGEQIQKGLCSGTNSSLLFGRFEQALSRFHEITESKLAD